MVVLRLLLAALHLLALGIGFGAVWARGRALARATDADHLRPAFYADVWWGIAALVWISTGLARLFGPFEKGTDYYFDNPLFDAKMGLLGLILVLEVWPMRTLIRWRVQLGKGQPVDLAPARRFATISFVQAALVVAMVLCAVAMARGYGVG